MTEFHCQSRTLVNGRGASKFKMRWGVGCALFPRDEASSFSRRRESARATMGPQKNENPNELETPHRPLLQSRKGRLCAMPHRHSPPVSLLAWACNKGLFSLLTLLSNHRSHVSINTNSKGYLLPMQRRTKSQYWKGG